MSPTLSFSLGSVAFYILSLLALGLGESIWPAKLPRLRWILTFSTLVLVLLVSGWIWLRWPDLQLGFLNFNRTSTFFVLMILGCGLLTCLQMHQEKVHTHLPVYSLLLLSTLSAIVMVASANLLVLFFAFELEIITLMMWLSSGTDARRSDEVKIKYFVTGGVSSAFLLMAVVIFYSLTGTFNLTTIQEKLLFMTDAVTVRLAIVCFLIGIAYKLAWVPFQFAVPDLYEGGVTPALGFTAVVSKLSGFAILLHFMNTWWYVESLPWKTLFTIMSVLCLLFGHVLALVQTNLKRRLAYSSIGQVGFLLAGMTAAGASPPLQEDALSAILFYCVAYSLMILGSFAIVWVLRTPDGVPVEDSDYAGLAHRAPWGAGCLALFLCSLSGLPPTIGFIGRFDLMRVVLAADHIGLAVAMMAAWILSVAANAQVVLAMYFNTSQHERTASISYPLLLVVTSCAILSLYWGLMPDTLLRIATLSAKALIY